MRQSSITERATDSLAEVKLPGYARSSSEPSLVRSSIGLLAKLLLAAMYGVLAVLLPPNLVPLLLVPVGVIFLIVLWMLPDQIRFPVNEIRSIFWLYLVLVVIWPVYIAIALPGLPWMTPTRFVLFITLAIYMYSISTSSSLRRDTMNIARSSSGLWICFLIWQAMLVVTMPFSKDVQLSIRKYADYQVLYTSVFFLSGFIFSDRGRATRAIGILIWLAVICSIVGFWELHLGYVPWAHHIPSFMRVDEATMQGALGSQARSSDGIYRVHSFFPLSLVMAEYLALCTPFIFHWLLCGQTILLRVSMFLCLLLVTYGIWITQSRLGLVGELTAFSLYMMFWAWRQWRSNPTAILGPAILLGTPLLIAMVLGIVFSSHTLTQKIMGGGAQQASNEARRVQREHAIPKVLANPIGHGLGSSGTVLGVANQAGVLSVDNHFITTALDLGVLGIIGFYGMFLVASWKGFRLYLSGARTPEEEIIGPLAVSFIVFCVIKFVLSQENNHSLVFLLLGMFVALKSGIERGWRETGAISDKSTDS